MFPYEALRPSLATCWGFLTLICLVPSLSKATCPCPNPGLPSLWPQCSWPLLSQQRETRTESPSVSDGLVRWLIRSSLGLGYTVGQDGAMLVWDCNKSGVYTGVRIGQLSIWWSQWRWSQGLGAGRPGTQDRVGSSAFSVTQGRWWPGVLSSTPC